MRIRCITFFILLTLLAPLAWPQASTGTVSGTVRDQTGAVIPSVSITLVNTATNVSFRTISNEAGFFMFPGVVPGPYRVSIDHSGMQRFEAGVTVQVSQSIVVDPILKPGQTTTTIEVQDITPMVKTDNPTLGHVLERQRIETLPVNGRAITSLLQTVPGMEGNRAYGLREGSQEMILDGAALSDRNWGGNPRRQPGMDAIQEFSAENSGASAKFSRPTPIIFSTKSGTNQFHGSAFETNRNNGYGVARRREDGTQKPPFLNRNEFGVSAGGPLYIPKVYNGKDRTFWFFAWEGQRNISPYTMDFQVPTAAHRNGDFSQLKDADGRLFQIYDPWTTDPQTWSRQQFNHGGKANVIDPNRINPLAKTLFGITPMPTMPEVNPIVDNNWRGPVPSENRNWTATTRVDHRLSSKDQIYGRFTRGEQSSVNQFYGQPMLNGIAGLRNQRAPNWNVAGSWVRTFTPTLFNELLISVAREKWYSVTGEPGKKYADDLGLPNPFNLPGWPGIYYTGLNNYYFETENTRMTPFTYAILDDNATKIMGRHELQFGFHFRFDRLNYLPEQQHGQGAHGFEESATALYDPATPRNAPLRMENTGQQLASMYLGLANYNNNFNRGYFYARAKEYAGYLQDNFRATSRLTLNMGLRWEYWPAYREKNNVLMSFDPSQKAIVVGRDLDTMYRLGATLPSIVSRFESLGAKFITPDKAGLPEQLMESTKKDFGPRFGFAYRAGDGAKQFVMRGVYRVSYFPIPITTWGQRMRMNAPAKASFSNYSLSSASQSPDGIQYYGMRSVPTVLAGVNSRDAVSFNDASSLDRGSAWISYFAPNQPDARVQDWNFTIEKEVLPDTVARVAYVGNHTSGLEMYNRYNEPTPEYIWFATKGEPLPQGEYAPVATRPFDQTVYGTIEEYQKSGFSNYSGVQFEFERRYSKGIGFQIFYNINNAFTAGGRSYDGQIPALNQFMPGTVPTDMEERNRFLNYQRDINIPKHSLKWNWVADLPFGKGRLIGKNANRIVDGVIGGWRISGMGSLRSNYFTLPTNMYPTGEKIEIYGHKYPIQDCRSGRCVPGYLWWNGYIPANRINSVDADGKPNGVMGVPANYKAAAQPLHPWPTNPDPNNPMYSYYGSNTVWVPLKDGTEQKTTYNDGLNPWRNQFAPSVRQWGLDAQMSKMFPITETVNVRFNLDAFNVLNHPNDPNNISSLGILRTDISGYGARQLQLTLRLSW